VVHPSPILLDSLRPLRRREYDRLIALGAFADERIELLAGVLVVISPQGAEHAETAAYLAERLAVALAGRARVRAHSPLSLSDESAPEPDVAVVPLGDYSREHPTSALLVIEVADSSLRKDRELKTELYAEAGVPEYWIVDLVSRCVHVHRAPKGGRYDDVSTLSPGAVVSPAAFAEIAIDIREVLRAH
jgi:Uma2 family endonuclease